jgi:hypothetical protein
LTKNRSGGSWFFAEVGYAFKLKLITTILIIAILLEFKFGMTLKEKSQYFDCLVCLISLENFYPVMTRNPI